MKGVWHFIVPELGKLDEHEQVRAWEAAERALGWRHWMSLLVMVLVISAVWLVFIRYHHMLISAGFILIPVPSIVVYRRALRRACWAILAERGEPICRVCGYNLAGNVSGRCPECGQVHRDL